MTRVALTRAFFVAAMSMMLPAIAAAQSGIAGVVKDATGGAIPGVTVEASSEVLIERTRSVVTDGEGQYRFVDLRPGAYSMTFSLAGFTTIKRDGIQLPADFVANISVDMRVGSLEETLTVTGDAPLVDVQSTNRSQVLTRDVLDAIPTGRSFQSVGQLVVGVQLSRPDVGGSQGMQQTYFAAHGMTSRNTTVQVDGMMMNSTRGDNQVNPYFNDAMNQEVSYETTGAGADVSAGGVRINMIPREGGNRFSGAFFTAYSDGAWQADNLTQDLKDQGLTAVDKIDKIYDVNFSIGGPVKQDKLWFFTSVRKWGVNSPVADVFYTPENVPFPVGYAQCKNGTASCEQAIDDQQITSGMARLTWQMSRKNKLGVYYDRLYKTRGGDMLAATDPRTASFTWRSPVYYTTQIKWTSTLTNKMLLDVGWGANTNVTVQNMQEGVEKPRGTADWYATAAHTDRDTGLTWEATTNIPTFVPVKKLFQASTTYVTGSHAAKFGVQFAERLVRAAAGRERRPAAGLPDVCARLGRRAQHPVRDARPVEPRPRVLRAGHLDHQAPDRQRRHPARETERRRPARAAPRPAASFRSGRSRRPRTCRTGPTWRRGSARRTICSAPARPRSSSRSTGTTTRARPASPTCTTRSRRRRRGSPGAT